MSKITYEAPKCYLVKVDQYVGKYLTKKHIIKLKFYNKLNINDRLFLVEYCGGRTGKAALCTVLENNEFVKLDKRIGWSQGKEDDDLSQFGLTIESTFDSILTKDNIEE